LAETSGNLETVKVGRTNRLGINLVNGTSRYQLGRKQSRQGQADLALTLAEASGNLETVKVGRTNRLGINVVNGTSRYQLGRNQSRQGQAGLALTVAETSGNVETVEVGKNNQTSHLLGDHSWQNQKGIGKTEV